MIIVILFLFSNKLQGVAKKSSSKSIKPSNTSDGEADETPQQPSGTIFRTYSVRCCNTSAAPLFISAGPLQIPADPLQKFAGPLPNQAGLLQKFAGPLPNLAGPLQISAGPH